jgi:hypothetical protein
LSDGGCSTIMMHRKARGRKVSRSSRQNDRRWLLATFDGPSRAADLVMTKGFGLEVDGRMKTVSPTLEAAQKRAGCHDGDRGIDLCRKTTNIAKQAWMTAAATGMAKSAISAATLVGTLRKSYGSDFAQGRPQDFQDFVVSLGGDFLNQSALKQRKRRRRNGRQTRRR